MREMDDSLGSTVDDVHQINELMTDTKGMLVDQTGKFQQMDRNNQDLHQGYREAE